MMLLNNPGEIIRSKPSKACGNKSHRLSDAVRTRQRIHEYADFGRFEGEEDEQGGNEKEQCKRKF